MIDKLLSISSLVTNPKVKQALELIKQGKDIYDNLSLIAKEDPKVWQQISSLYKDSYAGLIEAIDKKKASE